MQASVGASAGYSTRRPESRRPGLSRDGLLALWDINGEDTIGESTVLRSSVPANAHPTMQQVKGSGFAGAGSATVTGLLTTDTITATCATGSSPTCSVNGTLTFGASSDCWDVYVHRAGVLWAYWPGINIGQTTELDASGNGNHLTALTTTTITERVDGTGTDYCNVSGFSERENLLTWSDDFSNAIWNKYSGVLVSGNTATYPESANSAMSYTKSDFNTTDIFVMSFTALGVSGKTLRIYLVGPNSSSTLTLNGSLQNFSMEFQNNGTPITQVQIRNGWLGAHVVEITNVQLRKKTSSSDYVKTDSSIAIGRQPGAISQYTYTPDYDIRIGVFTDSHYSSVGSGCIDPEINIPAIIGNFDRVGCDIIVGLGDTYEGNYDDWTSEADMQTDVDMLESWFDVTNIPKAFVTGNHEKIGVYDIFGYSKYSKDFYSVDINGYRIIIFNNSRGPYFSADENNLLFLASSLEQARAESKKVILATHARIDQDWPGTPAKFTTEPSLPGNVTPSGVSGNGVSVIASTPSFTADMVGSPLIALHGVTWGVAEISSFISAVEVTVNISQNFGATSASDKWGLGGYSYFAYNSNAIRAIINSAIDSGTSIISVLTGHVHSYAWYDNVDGKGVRYYTFASSNTLPNGYVINITGSSHGVVTDESAMVSGEVSGNNLHYPTQNSGPLPTSSNFS